MKRSTRFGLIGVGVAVLILANIFIYFKVIKPIVSLRSSVVLQGPSMEPTFKDGKLLRTKKAAPDALKRGDVVVVEDPVKAGRVLVKRIVALGGDQVELRKGVVYLNGTPLDEPYAAKFSGADVAQITVPPGHVYLLGDNRGASFDSRHFGPQPATKVTAVVVVGN